MHVARDLILSTAHETLQKPLTTFMDSFSVGKLRFSIYGLKATKEPHSLTTDGQVDRW